MYYNSTGKFVSFVFNENGIKDFYSLSHKNLKVRPVFEHSKHKASHDTELRFQTNKA